MLQQGPVSHHLLQPKAQNVASSSTLTVCVWERMSVVAGFIPTPWWPPFTSSIHYCAKAWTPFPETFPWDLPQTVEFAWISRLAWNFKRNTWTYQWPDCSLRFSGISFCCLESQVLLLQLMALPSPVWMLTQSWLICTTGQSSWVYFIHPPSPCPLVVLWWDIPYVPNF